MREPTDILDELERERSRTTRPVRIDVVSASAVPGEERLHCLRVRTVRLRDRRLGPALEGAAFVADDGVRGDVIHVDPSDRPDATLDVYVRADADPPSIGPGALFPTDFLASLVALWDRPEHRPRLHAFLTATTPPAIVREAPGRAPTPLDAIWPFPVSFVWGPPGTGKTRRLGEQVAAMLSGPASHGRVLVVAPTNLAADNAARAIGAALRELGALAPNLVWRVGRGTRLSRKQHAALLPPSAIDLDAELAQVEAELASAATAAQVARLKSRRDLIRRAKEDSSLLAFALDRPRVVVSTMHQAIRCLTMVPHGGFASVLIDEAGMVAAPAASAVGLHASERVVLFGDPKQLAPIGGERCLQVSALESIDEDAPNVLFLRHQFRMATKIREVVSRYTYDARLEDGAAVDIGRVARAIPAAWGAGGVTIALLDHPSSAFGGHDARSELGRGQRSRIRRATEAVLRHLFATAPGLMSLGGVFVAPFRGQTEFGRRWLRDSKATNWQSTTIHAQQGGEHDVVVFDTVDLSKVPAWHANEWQRLVNVAVSRGRAWVLVLTTVDELRCARFARAFAEAARDGRARFVALGQSGGRLTMTDVGAVDTGEAPPADPRLQTCAPGTLGYRAALTRSAGQVLTNEQQRLVDRVVRDGPQLVRGIAGSGKTLVLAHWAVAAARSPGAKVLVVFGNQTMGEVVNRALAAAAGGDSAVLGRIDVQHVNRFLGLGVIEGRWRPARIDAAAHIAAAPRFDASFVDEAQDLPPEVIHAVARVTRDTAEYPGRPNIRVFFDNLQAADDPLDVAALGLDFRGRSAVMKESFRTTRQILEYAISVGDRLMPVDMQRETAHLGEQMVVGLPGQREVRFTLREGDPVEFEWSDDLLPALVKRIRRWIENGLNPNEIAVLTHRKKRRDALRVGLGAVFGEATLTIETAEWSRGKEFAAVAVVHADDFAEKRQRVLFMALTRAQHALWVGGAGDRRPDFEPTRPANTGSDRDRIDAAISALERERGRVLTEEQLRALRLATAGGTEFSADAVDGRVPLLRWRDADGVRWVLHSDESRAVEPGWSIFEL